jgi:HAMP domain-containing protein
VIAPSLAAAFLGCLAFVAWLLWLRRTDVRKAYRTEMDALRAQVTALRDEARSEVARLGPAILAIDARVDALTASKAFGGGR